MIKKGFLLALFAIGVFANMLIYTLLPFTYCMKKKYLIFLVLSFCLFSSCSTMLEIITGNYKCAYPNCNERATENSVYCPYHKPYYLK